MSRARVTISVLGGFHAFNLAEQVFRGGALDRVITGYSPGYARRRFHLSFGRRLLRSNYLQYPIELLGRVLPGDADTTYGVRVLHDLFASRNLPHGSNIVVGWSGCSLHTLQRARSAGKVAIVVRGSAHIAEQMRLLQEAYARCGLPFRVPKRSVEREIEEYSAADYIQTNSSFAKRTMIKHGIEEDRIIMVNTGTDLRRFQPVAKEDDLFRVVFAGGASIRKGTHFLLEAFSTANLPNSELMLIGPIDPELEPFLARFADTRFRHVGKVPQDELHRYLSQGTVFVMPSVEEGLAAVQAQAMACGLPLICSTNSGGEDLLSSDGEEGFVVPAGDAAAIREKLVLLHDNPALARVMGERARERVRTRCTWERYGELILAAYERLLSSPRHAL